MFNISLYQKRQNLRDRLDMQIQDLSKHNLRRQKEKRQAHASYLKKVKIYASQQQLLNKSKNKSSSLEKPWFDRQYIKGPNFNYSGVNQASQSLLTNKAIRNQKKSYINQHLYISNPYSDQPLQFRFRNATKQLHPSMDHSIPGSPSKRDRQVSLQSDSKYSFTSKRHYINSLISLQ